MDLADRVNNKSGSFKEFFGWLTIPVGIFLLSAISYSVWFKANNHVDLFQIKKVGEMLVEGQMVKDLTILLRDCIIT